MFKIYDSDTQPITEFPLSWRWTDPKWNLLPEADLQRIRPLVLSKAEELWRIAGQYVSATGPDVGIFSCGPWIDATLDTPETFERIRDWLLEQFSEREQSILVSWDKDHAVVTNWGVFCDYWDDFCYPASDDVTVLPLAVEWILSYEHGERFEFGRRIAGTA